VVGPPPTFPETTWATEFFELSDDEIFDEGINVFLRPSSYVILFGFLAKMSLIILDLFLLF
jgi:hypothetical protein